MNIEGIEINVYTRELNKPLNDLERLEIEALRELKNDILHIL